MTAHKQRLELTWIGKEHRPQLEPRILLEDPALSHHAAHRVTDRDIFDNRLIFGDNLLALKALEAEFAGTVKCVYIDPPFNTHQAMEHFEDGFEHSIWLSLLRDRLEVIYRLLTSDGSLFVHIDDNELGYLIAILDEIFGRNNRCAVITFKQASTTGHKAINPGMVSTSNFVLLYAKDKSQWNPKRVYTERGERDKRYGLFIEHREKDPSTWRFTTLMAAFAHHLQRPERRLKQALGDEFENMISEFVLENADRVAQLARPDYNAVSVAARALIDESRRSPDEVMCLERPGYSDMYLVGGQRVLFYADKLKLVDGRYVAGEPLTTIWSDILSNNLHNEGGGRLSERKEA